MYGTAGVSLSRDGPYQRVAVEIGSHLRTYPRLNSSAHLDLAPIYEAIVTPSLMAVSAALRQR